MALRRGFSASTTSINSPDLPLTLPTTRIFRLPSKNSVSMASMIRPYMVGSRKSKEPSTTGGMFLLRIIWRISLLRVATPFTFAASSSAYISSSEIFWSGAASTTRLAIWAEANLFSSQFLRKLATEGTKTRTSTIMMKSAVIINSLADRPNRNLTSDRGGIFGILFSFSLITFINYKGCLSEPGQKSD